MPVAGAQLPQLYFKFLLHVGHSDLNSRLAPSAPQPCRVGRRIGELYFLKLEHFNVLTSSSTNTKSRLLFLTRKNENKTNKKKGTPKQEKQTKFPKPHIKNGRLFITIIKVIKTYKTFF